MGPYATMYEVFYQYATCLSVTPKYVIWPFDTGFFACIGVKQVVTGQCSANGKGILLVQGREIFSQNNRKHEVFAIFAVPGPPHLPFSGSLFQGEVCFPMLGQAILDHAHGMVIGTVNCG
jgi:hypothetical protein